MAKLVIGVFSAETELIREAADNLTALFGPIDMLSPWLDFDYTDYYYAEMGRPLHRRLFAFSALVAQESLADIKLRTNAIEQRSGSGANRRINIDPGYLLKERFVLATGKNFSHRIYIGQGIYADLTLIYQHKAFQPLPWTYPDYAAEPMRTFLLQVRKRYESDLLAMGAGSPA